MTKKLYGSILVAALLSGCGAESTPEQEIANQERAPEYTAEEEYLRGLETHQIHISGVLYYDEPVGGVEVCADLNESFSCSSSDPTTTTNPDGTYELSWETKFPEQEYEFLATWENDISTPITTTLHHDIQFTKVGARSEHGGVINPLTTAELSAYHQLQRANYDQTDFSEELAELRQLYAEIYQLSADDVYTEVTSAPDFILITAIHGWMTTFTMHSSGHTPLAPAKVTRVLKDEYLERLKAEGISPQRLFMQQQRVHRDKVEQTLGELGYMNGTE